MQVIMFKIQLFIFKIIFIIFRVGYPFGIMKWANKDRYLEIYDWDMRQGVKRIRISDLRHRDQEVDLPDAFSFCS